MSSKQRQIKGAFFVHEEEKREMSAKESFSFLRERSGKSYKGGASTDVQELL